MPCTGLNNKLQVLPLFVSVLVVLIGYFGLFTGKTFFNHEDWTAVSNHTAGNKDSNGWRADKGLGLSYFYGDPGMWHPWAIFSFLERVLPTREAAYEVSVVLLDIAAVIIVYFFALRFFPQFNPWVVALLAPLAVFCFEAPSNHYSRAFISLIAAFPLVIWLLYAYFQRPRWIHIFLFACLLWAVAFLGNVWSMTQVLMIGFVFSIAYYVYHKNDAGRQVRLFMLMYALALPAVVALGAWVFYSFGLDQMTVGYAREKFISFEGFKFIPEFKSLISYLAGFIPFNAIPINHNLAALNYVPYHLGVSVLFVFGFLFFLGRKAESFWEFALKVLLVVYFVHGIFVYGKLIPAVSAVFQFIVRKTSTLFTMYLFVFSIQTLMIIFFVSMVSPQNVLSIHRLCRRLQVLIAAITAVCYASVIIVFLVATLAPGTYFWITDQWIPSQLPDQVGGYSKELLSYLLSYNAHRYQELIRPQWFLFFASSLLIAGVFMKDRWLRFAAGLPKVWIAGVLMVNAVLLTWSFYPLSDKPLVWERPEVQSLKFEPTDRFYLFRHLKWEKTVEGFKKKWETADDHGPRKNLVGYSEPPGLNISGFKSFATQAEVNFIGRILKEAGFDYKRLYYGENFVSSDLLDMAAVKYYYSDNIIENFPSTIVPYAQFEQLYIYKNTAAWPYFYLADRIESQNGPIEHPVRGTAYVAPKDRFDLPEDSPKGNIALTEFRPGRMVFDYKSLSGGFLVIADGWHPFWQARSSQGETLRIIKANEVFKGVRLPAGNYQVEMYFDVRPYLPGVWVSIAAWILWGAGFVWAYRSRREIYRGA